MINNFNSINSFVFYESVYKQAEIIEKRVGIDAAYTFLNDVISYGLYGVLPEEESESWLYGFEQVMASINGAKNRYEAAVGRGKRGGRPKIELNQEEVLQKKEELKTWKAVAEYYSISEQALKNYRSQWEQEQKEETKMPPPQDFIF